MTDEEREFYLRCATAAMQGSLACGENHSIAADEAGHSIEEQIAREAFDVADAMVDEARRRFRELYGEEWGGD